MKNRAVTEASDCQFGQALELGATEGDLTRIIELKNENLPALDLGRPLTFFHKLTHLNISMNKIANI